MNERRDALLRVPGPAEACPFAEVRSTACRLFRTLAAMIAPCSVKAHGRYVAPRRPLKLIAICDELVVSSRFPAVCGIVITTCDLRLANSFAVSWNAKSRGNRCRLRLIASLRLDPKIAAGPVTLAVTDFVALALYFGIASLMLMLMLMLVLIIVIETEVRRQRTGRGTTRQRNHCKVTT